MIATYLSFQQIVEVWPSWSLVDPLDKSEIHTSQDYVDLRNPRGLASETLEAGPENRKYLQYVVRYLLFELSRRSFFKNVLAGRS